MSTILSFLSGRQITNNSGVPQAGAKLYHYREGTTTALTVWTDDAATVAHGPPAGVVTCDAGGFVPLVYVDDTFDWKVVIKTAADVTLQTYDNLPKAVTAASSAAFAPPLLEWTQVTSAASPVALTVNDAGNAYEADTTGGSIEFDLPDAASVGNGKGFYFKKTATGNSMIIDPSGSQTIDDVSTSLTITSKDTVIGIFSNGAEWYRVTDIPIPFPTVQRFTSGSGTYTPAAGVRLIRVRMVGGGGGGGASSANTGSVGGDTSFAAWTAIHGNGGAAGNMATPGAGGTGGVNGTGTLLARFDGQAGSTSAIASSFNLSGAGGSTPFGGGGPQSFRSSGSNAGHAAKANSGSGGGGAANDGSGAGAGGGAGEYVEFYVSTPVAVSYAVGAGGAGGAAGGSAGGAGAAGIIIVEEYY
jgi:hypothetical protein